MAIVMAFSSLPADASSNDRFNDLLSNHWAFEYITEATNQGFAQGYEDGSFRPDLPATYAHVSAFLSRAFYPSDATTLSDEFYNWSAPYIQTMNQILSNPQTIDILYSESNATITIYDMAQMMYDILVDHNIINISNPPTISSLEQLHFGDSVSPTYLPAISAVYSLGLLDGILDVSSLHNGTVTRAQSCVAVVRLSRYINQEHNTPLSGLIVGGSLTITELTTDGGVYFVLENSGSKTFSYDGIPALERYENGRWVDVPSLSGTFSDISILRLLSPGQKKDLSSNLIYWYGSLSPGLYRLSLGISQDDNRFLLSDLFYIKYCIDY